MTASPREHEDTARDCWCEPVPLMLCPMCAGVAAYTQSQCERCRGRALVAWDEDEMDDCPTIWWHQQEAREGP